MVFFNALSGSFAYARDKRIDYKSGLMFSAAAVPGSILGALSSSFIPIRVFDGTLGVLMIAVSLFLIIKPENGKNVLHRHISGHFFREITDARGNNYKFSYNPMRGIIISVFTGYFSSLLGIGGGIIHVPAMVNLLNFPVHIATATSHFILGIMSFSGSLVHLIVGNLKGSALLIIALSAGVVIGAQAGAALSGRFHGSWIIRVLAIALALVGIRIFIMAFWR